MQWFTREEAGTDPEFGGIPEKRSVEELLDKGFVLIDKPFGPTSNQVSYWVKEMLDRQKAGHFGTLDPNATGVLPVGLDSGTRVQDALSQARKEYIFEAELREEKDEEEVNREIQSFEGANTQTPPDHSAVKQEERQRKVYDIELIEKKGKSILGRVSCESGFYVRVLVDQLGEKLGTDAEMEELRRTRQGGFDEEDAHTLQEVVDAYRFYKDDGNKEKIREVLHPIEHAVKDVNKIVVKDSAVNAVANGSNLGSTGISKLQDGIEKGEAVGIMTLKGELVALAEAEMTSEEMAEDSGTATDLRRVFMDKDVYPKGW
jgi:H/ACA ribonucleoprotein complex subunit 4